MKYDPADLVPQLRLARKHTRLVNFLIDSLCFATLFVVWRQWIFGGILSTILPNATATEVLMVFWLYFFYYAMFEYGMGQTPGKLITGTKVVDINGQKPPLKSILLRCFFRFFPLYPFSLLADDPIGRHDSWSKTRVWSSEAANRFPQDISL